MSKLVPECDTCPMEEIEPGFYVCKKCEFQTDYRATGVTAFPASLRVLDAEVAEVIMGLTGVEVFQVRIFGNLVQGGRIDGGGLLPAYSADLNACFEAQAKCVQRVGVGSLNYIDALSEEIAADDGCKLVDHWEAFARCATATAKQRCLAMLRAVAKAEATA